MYRPYVSGWRSCSRIPYHNRSMPNISILFFDRGEGDLLNFLFISCKKKYFEIVNNYIIFTMKMLDLSANFLMTTHLLAGIWGFKDGGGGEGGILNFSDFIMRVYWKHT